MGKDNQIVDGNGESRISVEDDTVAPLNEVESPEHHRDRFMIGY